MYLIDTNIFLEILLEQEKADNCIQFFEQLSRQGDLCLVTSYSLHSIETILTNLKRYDVLINFLEDLIGNINIRPYQTTPEEELEIIQNISKFNLDFDDSLQYYVAKKV
ncbi:VapC toxin family PIN domain ribonuclease, partial [candidate division KSB1 bacterium]|nr:VapC toxin family PIN domain ribonuclease [candidate division KSB1 bacterium]